jgi:hypothetical protein
MWVRSANRLQRSRLAAWMTEPVGSFDGGTGWLPSAQYPAQSAGVHERCRQYVAGLHGSALDSATRDDVAHMVLCTPGVVIVFYGEAGRTLLARLHRLNDRLRLIGCMAKSDGSTNSAGRTLSSQPRTRGFRLLSACCCLSRTDGGPAPLVGKLAGVAIALSFL